MEEKEGLAVTYAALILHDDGHRVTTEKLNKLMQAANVTVAPYWSALFENVLRDRDMEQLLANLPSGSSASNRRKKFRTAKSTNSLKNRTGNCPTILLTQEGFSI